MRIDESRQLRDGRLLTWVWVHQTQACATPLDYATDGKIDGVSITDAELRRMILGR